MRLGGPGLLTLATSSTLLTHRWRARISVGGRQQNLGFYTEEIDAARAYDAVAAKRGRRINFTVTGEGAIGATAEDDPMTSTAPTGPDLSSYLAFSRKASSIEKAEASAVHRPTNPARDPLSLVAIRRTSFAMEEVVLRVRVTSPPPPTPPQVISPRHASISAPTPHPPVRGPDTLHSSTPLRLCTSSTRSGESGISARPVLHDHNVARGATFVIDFEAAAAHAHSTRVARALMFRRPTTATATRRCGSQCGTRAARPVRPIILVLMRAQASAGLCWCGLALSR